MPSDFQASVKRGATVEQIAPPEDLIRYFPVAGMPVEPVVLNARKAIQRILNGADDKLLVVIGPCSIHDPAAAFEYARLLAPQRIRYSDTLEIVMRVYFEKPRTTVGWKGLINDPYLDGSFRINDGLRVARQLLIDINSLGVPAGSEFLDVISPQYIGDLIAWGAIGARTTESQVHRELASGLSAPIGFKNGTDGNIRIAVDAIQAAARGHHFLSVNKNGHVAIVETTGNPDCHVILRGGKTPNYDAQSVLEACQALDAAGLRRSLMVDCSHANSEKKHARQVDVARDIAAQIAGGSRRIFGVMVESHLKEGAQRFSPGQDSASDLVYGQSITDACLGWDDSLLVLKTLSEAVKERRGLGREPVQARKMNGSTVYSVGSSSPDSAFVDLVDAPMPQPRSTAAGLEGKTEKVGSTASALTIGLFPSIPWIPYYSRSKEWDADLRTCESSGVRELAGKQLVDITPMATADWFALSERWHRLDNWGIAFRKKAGSVLLFSHDPIERLSGVDIAICGETTTSVRVLEAILKGKYGLQIGQWRRNVDAADARTPRLLIQNQAVEEAQQKRFQYVYDIGREWWDWQGTPIVSALWVCRHDLDQATRLRASRLLKESMEHYSMHNFEVIGAHKAAHKWPSSVQEVQALHGNFEYALGDECELGIQRMREVLPIEVEGFANALASDGQLISAQPQRLLRA